MDFFFAFAVSQSDVPTESGVDVSQIPVDESSNDSYATNYCVIV